MADYVILRDATAAPTAAPFDLGRRGRAAAGARARPSLAPGAGLAPPPAPQVEVQNLTPKGVREAARDPTVVGVARRMPTRLIAPVEPQASAAAAGDAGASAAGDAWGIAAVGAGASARTGAGVTVAVLDTGIDRNHTAFAGVQLVERDFSGDGNGDVQGHGTHCAGTIFGRDVGGRRIGVARGVTRALIGKVLADDGRGSSEMIFEGIQWAMQNGANVVSMSLGFDFPGLVRILMEGEGLPTEAAVSVALEAYRGNLRMFDALMNMAEALDPFGGSPVIVAAAGNESARGLAKPFEIAASLPAAAEGVISVAALRQEAGGATLGVADFSNTFAVLSAPGQAIPSARAGTTTGLTEKSGTSMACPHVAGVACLWWEELREAGQVVPAASLVVAQLMARARTNVFTAGLDPVDRGAGLVSSPPAA